MTWLLVEDDPEIRNLVAVMMQLWGEKPLALPDGNAAWNWLDGVVSGTVKGELPDLALMDIRMPGHTGDQIAARIRATDRLKNITIILMTAFSLTDGEIRDMVNRSGIDHLVKKPLPDMDDFRKTLYRIRDERRTRGAAPAVPGASLPRVAPQPVIQPPGPVAVAPAKMLGTKTVKLSAPSDPSKPLTPAAPKPSTNGKPKEPPAPLTNTKAPKPKT